LKEKKEEENFGKKSKKNENKHVEKVKAEFLINSILKKINKDNFGKKTCGETL
jgi:hypothetical protein